LLDKQKGFIIIGADKTLPVLNSLNSNTQRHFA